MVPRPSSTQLPANSSAGCLRAKQKDRKTYQPIKKSETLKKEREREQKNIAWMKKQSKNLQDQINEEEIGNLPKKEFRVMIVKMILKLGNKTETWIKKI